MSTHSTPLVAQVGILVLDENVAGGTAIKQVLDTEGWRVRVVRDVPMLMSELKSGECSLVIANIATIGVDGPVYSVLKELCTVPQSEGGRIRILYIIPEMGGRQFIGHLEVAHLPYVLRPYHLHDFLEKVSDLLVEVKAIEGPIRQVRHEFGALRKKKKKLAAGKNSMFASRDSFSYSDEELAEYERAELESSASKRRPRTNLGGGDR